MKLLIRLSWNLLQFCLVRTKTRRLCYLLVATLVGCARSPTSQIGAFKDASATTDVALKLLDLNTDGAIDEQELAACPGLQSGAARIDSDGNQRLEREELLARFKALGSMSDVVGLQVIVVKADRPLANAKVTLIPAAFLGAGLQAYRGVSDPRGNCVLTGDSVPLPGLPTGYYTAEITHGPAGVNKQIGCEIADDASGSRIQLKL